MAIKAGSEIDAWCTSCRLTLNHRVVAMVAGVPKRVLCLTCNKQHNFRRPKSEGAGESSSAASASKAGSSSKSKKSSAIAPKSPSPAREWQTNVADRDSSDFVPYSIHTTFETGQLVDHPKFGWGYVKETMASQKLCILFKDGPRTLVHGRS
ncbi:MAG TPA: hypothetical protein VMG12_22235 [Polyangiaceae bacterium]|nr:hypothetical protein [Polyangiaceae bacterium]